MHRAPQSEWDRPVSQGLVDVMNAAAGSMRPLIARALMAHAKGLASYTTIGPRRKHAVQGQG